MATLNVSGLPYLELGGRFMFGLVGWKLVGDCFGLGRWLLRILRMEMVKVGEFSGPWW